MPTTACTPITVAVRGEAYCGFWRIKGRLIQVTSDFGSTAAELGEAPPEAAAAALLAELVRARLTAH